jgi:hypothetical protein
MAVLQRYSGWIAIGTQPASFPWPSADLHVQPECAQSSTAVKKHSGAALECERRCGFRAGGNVEPKCYYPRRRTMRGAHDRVAFVTGASWKSLGTHHVRDTCLLALRIIVKVVLQVM